MASSTDSVLGAAEVELTLLLRRTINHCPCAGENQSDFRQFAGIRLSAMEFTPWQEIARRQEMIAAAEFRRPQRAEDLRQCRTGRYSICSSISRVSTLRLSS